MPSAIPNTSLPRFKRRQVIQILALFSLPFGCTPKAEEEGKGQPSVLCTTTMIHDLAKIIAGGNFEIHGMMKPGEDPHIYELKPHDTVLIGKVDLVLMNGLHLESQVGHVVDEKARGKVVRLAEDQRIIPLGGEAGNGAPDPHCWFAPGYYKIYAEKARDAFIELDPANAVTYEQRTDAYKKEIDEIDAWGKEAFRAIPESRRIMVTSHDAFQYFGKAFGIEVAAVGGISTEGDTISPQNRVHLEELVRERGARALFIESSVPGAYNSIVRKIAESTGAKVGGMLHSDSLGDPESGADTYLSMLRHNLTTVIEALK
jgi:manganese/zinc/iron transport system substrate-binding protein